MTREIQIHTRAAERLSPTRAWQIVKSVGNGVHGKEGRFGRREQFLAIDDDARSTGTILLN